MAKKKQPEFKVWFEGDESHARFLVETTDLSKYRTSIEKIKRGPQFPRNPDTLQKMLYLDMPDVVVTCGFPERAVMAVEFCAEAPSGHDVFQRIARVAAAADFGAPFAFVFPERKWVIRQKAGRWDSYNPSSLRALINIGRFHAVPVAAFFWEADEANGDPANGYLLCDYAYQALPCRRTQEMRHLIGFVNLVLTHIVEDRDFREMVFHPLYMEREAWMWQRFSERVTARPRWSPLTSCQIVKTSDLLAGEREKLQQDITPPDYVAGRAETVVYQPATSQFRSDPYAGALIGIDYLECRNGPTIRHRYRNLAVRFPRVGFAAMSERFLWYYTRRCPFRAQCGSPDSFLTLHLKDGCRYTKQKELRIYCYAADLIMFKDAILY